MKRRETRRSSWCWGRVGIARWHHPREHLVLCAGRNETSVGLNDALVRPRQPEFPDGAAANLGSADLQSLFLRRTSGLSNAPRWPYMLAQQQGARALWKTASL